MKTEQSAIGGQPARNADPDQRTTLPPVSTPRQRKPPPPPDSGRAKKYDYTPMPPGPQIASNPDGSQPFVDTDPLKEILNQGEIKFHGENDDSIPEELGDFLTSHDMSKRYFQVVLKRLDEGADDGSSNAAFIRSWYRGIPSLEWIVNNYGPGRYIFVVNWRQVDAETGKYGAQSEKIPFLISDRCQAQYDEYQRSKRISTRKAEADRLRTMKLDTAVDNAIDGAEEKPPTDVKAEARAYLQEITSFAREMGLSRSEGSGMSWIKDLLPVLVPAIAAFMESQGRKQQALQAQYNNMLTLMLSQADKSNQQLLEVVKVSQGTGAGQNYIKEFKDMVLGAVDLKEALNGNKESVADKIFGVIETVLPQIVAISAQSKMQQAMDPRVALARSFVQTNPDFRAATGDPEIMAAVIRKLDSHYGWRQTDNILTVAGIERPTSCPRNDDEMNPADQRPALPQTTEDPENGPDNAETPI